jgi:hypothetical protein
MSTTTGALLWRRPVAAQLVATAAFADLDGDGDLEVVLGHAAYHHDGTRLLPDRSSAPATRRSPTSTPTPSPRCWSPTTTGSRCSSTTARSSTRTSARPATRDRAHDVAAAGDGPRLRRRRQAEYAVSSANNYTVYEPDATIVWQADGLRQSGHRGGHRVRLPRRRHRRGDVRRRENFMFIFDGAGQVLLQIARGSSDAQRVPDRRRRRQRRLGRDRRRRAEPGPPPWPRRPCR